MLAKSLTHEGGAVGCARGPACKRVQRLGMAREQAEDSPPDEHRPQLAGVAKPGAQADQGGESSRVDDQPVVKRPKPGDRAVRMG